MRGNKATPLHPISQEISCLISTKHQRAQRLPPPPAPRPFLQRQDKTTATLYATHPSINPSTHPRIPNTYPVARYIISRTSKRRGAEEGGDGKWVGGRLGERRRRGERNITGIGNHHPPSKTPSDHWTSGETSNSEPTRQREENGGTSRPHACTVTASNQQLRSLSSLPASVSSRGTVLSPYPAINATALVARANGGQNTTPKTKEKNASSFSSPSPPPRPVS